MLENLQVNSYGFDSYTVMNDSLLFIDYIDDIHDYEVITITPDMSYRYQGNFLGLLKELKVSSSLYLFTMHLNGIYNPTDFNGTMTSIKIAMRPPIPSS